MKLLNDTTVSIGSEENKEVIHNEGDKKMVNDEGTKETDDANEVKVPSAAEEVTAKPTLQGRQCLPRDLLSKTVFSRQPKGEEASPIQ